ncbi:MAG: AMP-binding protein [Verrucomicrobiota bacterium]
MTETLSPIPTLAPSNGVADAYWRGKLYQGEQAVNLPFDLPMRTGDGFHFAKVERRLEPGIEPLMVALSESVNCSLSDLWEALVLALLMGYGQESSKITIGSSAERRSSRPRCEDPIADLILGFVSGTEILQAEAGNSTTFRDLLQKPGVVLRSTPSQELLKEIATEDISKLRPAMSAVYGQYPASRISSAGCDLAFSWSEESGLSLQYNTFRISRGGANRIMGHLVTLAAWLSSEPDRPIVEIEFLTENERESLAEWNQTERLSDFRGRTIYQLFEARYELRPATTALVDADGNASYQTLNNRVNQIALQLRSLGASPGQNVAICAERTLDLVATFLAVWKIGAVALPIDGTLAAERIRSIIKNLEPAVWVHDGNAPGIKEQVPKRLDLGRIRVASKREMESGSSVSILPDASARVLVSESDSVVKISHRALINRFAWFWRVYPFRIGQIGCAHHRINSSEFIYETLVPLLEGIPVVLIDQMTADDPQSLLKVLNNNRVSRILSDELRLRRMIDAIHKEEDLDLINMRHWFSRGHLRADDVVAFRKWFPESSLITTFGTAETAGVSAAFDTSEFGDTDSEVPFGQPIDNSQVEVRNQEGKLVPLGVWGQLWFGGLSISKEYFSLGEAGNGSFIERDGQRWFVSQRHGRWMPSGNLEISGKPNAAALPKQEVPIENDASEMVEDAVSAETVAEPVVAQRPRRRIRENLDKEVATIWGQILGGVPSDQNLKFSELGGDLDGLATMVVAISHQLKRKVSVGEVMARETIAELREFLKSYDDRLENWRGIVSLRGTGSKTPVVFFHDQGLGAMGAYAKISSSLSSERGVYVFASRGLSGFEEFQDLKTMAGHYVSEIRAQFGDRELVLGGLYFGGRIAMEVARQIREHGQKVPFVVPMESQPKFNTIGRKWFGLLSRDQGSHGLNIPAQYREVSGVLRRVKRLAGAQRVMNAEHFDEAYDGNVALLRLATSKTSPRAGASDLGWSKCVRGNLEVLPVAVEDSIEKAAEQIGRRIEELI